MNKIKFNIESHGLILAQKIDKCVLEYMGENFEGIFEISDLFSLFISSYITSLNTLMVYVSKNKIQTNDGNMPFIDEMLDFLKIRGLLLSYKSITVECRSNE